MVSGIGPAATLKEVGIPILSDLPGVGQPARPAMVQHFLPRQYIYEFPAFYESRCPSRRNKTMPHQPNRSSDRLCRELSW